MGFNVLQLLPLNDSGYESSPYNALTSTGLHPIYLSLHRLPFVERDTFLQTELQKLHRYRRTVRAPYEAILNAKYDFLQLYYQLTFAHFSKTPQYQEFVQKNPWLPTYSLFKVLKEEHHHSPWSTWAPTYRDPSKRTLKRLIDTKKNCHFYTFLQFLCFMQLTEVKRYANLRGILLKGDIPILVSQESVDVWLHREVFRTEFTAGSPPDQFCPDGQNWGFPIYNWDHLVKERYGWWENRLQCAEQIYDIFRVDHIIGFYRIFAIPEGCDASFGNYMPHEHWQALLQGETSITRLLTFTKMLPIGEDLGVDIRHIQDSMTHLGIPGTRIPRWMTEAKSVLPFMGTQYTSYKDYPQISLTTVSTHDSETLTQWWLNAPKEAKAFARFSRVPYTKTLSQKMRYTMLKDSHHSASLFHINLLGEYLALFEDLVWSDAEYERINRPGTVSPANWTYRMRPTIQEITQHEALYESVRSMTEASTSLIEASQTTAD